MKLKITEETIDNVKTVTIVKTYVTEDALKRAQKNYLNKNREKINEQRRLNYNEKKKDPEFKEKINNYYREYRKNKKVSENTNTLNI